MRKPSWGGSEPGLLLCARHLSAGHGCAGMGSAPGDTRGHTRSPEANASLLWRFIGLWRWPCNIRARFSLKEPWAHVRGREFLS